MVTRNIIVATLAMAIILPKLDKAMEPLILPFGGKPAQIAMRATGDAMPDDLPAASRLVPITLPADHAALDSAAARTTTGRFSATPAPAIAASAVL